MREVIGTVTDMRRTCDIMTVFEDANSSFMVGVAKEKAALRKVLADKYISEGMDQHDANIKAEKVLASPCTFTMPTFDELGV